ncbi:MAG TPA: TetR family transcriptional regulator [Kofleriaceae bacterium]
MTAKPLSRDRIVDAAIALLDEDGEAGLTFRALAANLATGAGAIYWHVASKQELLLAASDAVVTRALDAVRGSTKPREAIRRLAAGVYDAIDAHPWVGPQLVRAPWAQATLKIFERVGRQLPALGVARAAHFTAASALLGHIVGVSVQSSANGHAFDLPMTRAELLESEAARWQQLDAAEFPFLRSVATELRVHDDRAEYLAGVDLIVAGVTTGAARGAARTRP